MHVHEISRRNGRLALRMDDAPLVVEDSDELQFQGSGYYFAPTGLSRRPPLHKNSRTMKLRPRDVISYQGQDFVVEGILSYKLAGKIYPLARAVDGDEVRWIEPLMDDLDAIDCCSFARCGTCAWPRRHPPTIAYKGASYVPRLSGTATVDVEGSVSDRAAGSCELWRYRAAGDLFLQIEKWSGKNRHPGGRIHSQRHGPGVPGALTRRRTCTRSCCFATAKATGTRKTASPAGRTSTLGQGPRGGQAAGQLLKSEGYTFDLAFTSVLKRAIRTLWIVLDEMDLLWLPVERNWRLNERHYGALQGLNKAETAAEFGDEQVKIWRRSYDIPPPPSSPATGATRATTVATTISPHRSCR